MRTKAVYLALALALAVLLAPATFAQYVRTDLVSNQNGVGTNTPDQHLVNAWGLTALLPQVLRQAAPALPPGP